ncbi:MAG: flavodoxin [Dysgonomonas sp.]
MAKIGIYYGSDTGNTKDIAAKIAEQLGVSKADIHDVNNAKADFSNYDVLLFGTSSTGYGDLQSDWESFLPKVENADLTNKTVALFGCGDSGSYSDTFGNGMGHIYAAIKDKGCKIIGQTSTDGYTFDESEAVVDGNFVGLMLDEDNEHDLTDERIGKWLEQIKKRNIIPNLLRTKAELKFGFCFINAYTFNYY